MNNIQIVVDSTAYLTQEYINEHNIEVAELSVELDNIRQKEGLPGNFGDFFNRFEKSQNFPKTSQPPVGEFVECYEKAFERGSEIMVITFSSKLSGTYSSAKLAADMFEDGKITVVDSKTAVGNYRAIIDKAVNMSKDESSIEEILKAIEEIQENMNINLTVESLEYLKRGGRLSNAQAIIGSLLKIKPIIGLIDGELIAIDKVRGKKKALELMISKIPVDVKEISVEHVQYPEEAERIKDILESKFENVKISVNEIGPVVGSHIGPKAVGICSIW